MAHGLSGRPKSPEHKTKHFARRATSPPESSQRRKGSILLFDGFELFDEEHRIELSPQAPKRL